MWNPKDNMSLCAYWTAFDGLNLSGNNVIGLIDLSGNGNDLTAINNPQIVANGINGVQSIRFNGTNRLERLLPINGISDLSKRTGWIVFKIEDVNGVGYHNIFLIGANNYTTAGTNFVQLYSLNNSNPFLNNYSNNTLDLTLSLNQLDAHFCLFEKGSNSFLNMDGSIVNSNPSTQNINNNSVFIGQWNGKGAKMLFCEMGITETISSTDKENLTVYLFDKYGIKQNIEVINSGVSGNNSLDVINRLPSINAYMAKLAFLTIGTNCFRHPDIGKRLTVAQYKANLTTIVQSLKANGTDVILTSMFPIEPTESDYICSFFNQNSGCDTVALANQYRDAMMEVSVEQDVDYFDIYSKFLALNQPRYTYDSFMENIFNSSSADGVHLTAKGAEFVARLRFGYLNEKQYKHPKIIDIGDSTIFCDGLPIEKKSSTILQKLLNT